MRMESGRGSCSCFSNTNVHLRALVIEPFYGGSHKQLLDIMVRNLTQQNECEKKITIQEKFGQSINRTYLDKIRSSSSLSVDFCSFHGKEACFDLYTLPAKKMEMEGKMQCTELCFRLV